MGNGTISVLLMVSLILFLYGLDLRDVNKRLKKLEKENKENKHLRFGPKPPL